MGAATTSNKELDVKPLITHAAHRAASYLAALPNRRVFPSASALEGLTGFDRPLQDQPLDPAQVLEELDRIGSPATAASAGGRYFGFVIGGCLPAALAANILAGAWDQNAGLEITSPVAAALEKVCRTWLVAVLGLPAEMEVGFVSGATMANFTGLAAARHALLEAQGWDVEARGLFGAPPLTVIVGDEVHASLLKALSLLGLGRDRVVRVPADGQGRLVVAQLPKITGPTIVCLQAGNVNTGAFDPIDDVATRLESTGAWLHVDGAFGLWAAASPARRHLTRGLDKADSIAADAHKWLNVPYDSGLAFVRERRHLNAAMGSSAAYLLEGDSRDPLRFVPEMSRRARAIEIWAALRSLGRTGLAELIDRCCGFAQRFAQAFEEAGYEVLNDIVLNQVLVSFGPPELTRRVIARVQEDASCWCGGTVWQGRTAMRLSVSSWATTADDVTRSLDAILRIAAEVQRSA
jgi:glutamate/tyrosine decarboxylase-like PLP-dependent enzyme